MNKFEKLKNALKYNLEDEDLVLLAYDLWNNNPNFNYYRDIEDGFEHYRPFGEEVENDTFVDNSYIRKFIHECNDFQTVFRSLVYVYDLSEFLDLSVSDILYIIINIFTKNLNKIDVNINSIPILDTNYKEEITLYKNNKLIENVIIKYDKKRCKFTYYKNGETTSFIIFKKGQKYVSR